MKFKLTLIAGAMCLIWGTASFAAPGVEAAINQTGSGSLNEATIEQTQGVSGASAEITQSGAGSSNEATVSQYATQGVASIIQTGPGVGGNVATINQESYGVINASITQGSEAGSAGIYQTAGDPASVLNSATIEQSSPNALANIYQVSVNESAATIKQFGTSLNEASITQGQNGPSFGLQALIKHTNSTLFDQVVSVTQDGTRQLVSIEMDNALIPSITITQSNQENSFTLVQIGDGNVLGNGTAVVITQTGDSSVAVLQYGMGNTALNFDQSGGSVNELSITQFGNLNLAGISQIGSLNIAAISQSGDSHRAKVIQDGSGNFAEVIQEVNTNLAVITQAGSDNGASITQTGSFGNAAAIQQYISLGAAHIFQTSGSGNYASILQQ